jgi:hypothetical protein
VKKAGELVFCTGGLPPIDPDRFLSGYPLRVASERSLNSPGYPF